MPEKRKIVTFTANLNASMTRHETHEGKDTIVAPMVMMTEGVHNGSNGPIFYSKEDLEKTAQIWNAKPVVVYHPEINGQGISACDPDVFKVQKVGTIFNAHVKDGKLKAEAWLDPDRLAEVDDRILAAIETNSMMELSTGLFSDQVEEEGTFNDETFSIAAHNIGPDHLAILPDKIGACSIADGAGLLRNESFKGKAGEKILSRLMSKMTQKGFEKTLNEFGLDANELSHGTIREDLRIQLRERFLSGTNDINSWVWVEEVFDDFVIYELDIDSKPMLFKLSYSTTDTAVTLSDEDPIEVVRVVEFRTRNGNFVGSQENSAPNTNDKQGEKMDKKIKTIVDGLISDNSTGWSDEDREYLEGQEEAILNKMAPIVVEPTEPEPTANAEPEPGDKPRTVGEYIENSPAEIRDALRDQFETHNAQKAAVIKEITDNEKNHFEQAQLEGMDLKALKNIAALARVEKTQTDNHDPNYGGNVDGEPIDNTEEPLLAPDWASVYNQAK